MCTARPAPASFFDWIVSIAHVNFLPGTQAIADYFEAVKSEIAERVATGEGAVPGEKFRLFFDGMMNWNKVGWLADKFASVGAAVVAGRYTHMSFWQEPELIDLRDPVLGMAQNYLIRPNNHGAPIMIGEINKLCDKFEVDGMVMHASRTCRGMTNSQFLIADSAKRHGRQALFFEGDVADEFFLQGGASQHTPRSDDRNHRGAAAHGGVTRPAGRAIRDAHACALRPPITTEPWSCHGGNAQTQAAGSRGIRGADFRWNLWRRARDGDSIR